MSYVDPHLDVTVGQAVADPVVPQTTETALLQCLVVSADQPRRQMLTQAATDAGWDTVVCADADNALAESQRSCFQLALIDMQGRSGPTPSGFREFCEHLTESSGKQLLAVCGHEGDAKEEIWARQLGAWLYLPGLTDGEEMSVLCGEARTVAKQVMVAQRAARI